VDGRNIYLRNCGYKIASQSTEVMIGLVVFCLGDCCFL
jgi:hypothetical protein